MTPNLPEIVLDQDGQHIYLTDEQIDLLGDLTVPRFEAMADPDHGYDVRRQRVSLLRSPHRHRIPNAGCLMLLSLVARTLGYRIHRRMDVPIARLPEPENRDALHFPQLADFVRNNERAVIRIPDQMDEAILIADLAESYPNKHIIVIDAKLANLKRVQKRLKEARAHAGIIDMECEPIPVVHDRGRLFLDVDDEMPKLVLSTPLGAGDLDFATSDLVIFLNATQCIHNWSQTILQQVDARFRLFGITRPGQQISPYEAGMMMAVFGPNLIDLLPNGQTRRDTHIAWVQHNQQWIPGQKNATEFNRKCIWNNDRRNRMIANLAQTLVSGAPLDQKKFADVKTWFTGRTYKPQAVTILVNSLHHARALSQKLRDSPVVIDPEADLSGMAGSFRNRVKRDRRRWLDGSRQIVMADAAQTIDGRHSDVIIWAGSGPHPPAIPNFWFGQGPGVNHPLLIVDFRDNFNAQARDWSRQRKKHYADQDIFEVGMDPMVGRIRRFLRQQPGGRR